MAGRRAAPLNLDDPVSGGPFPEPFGGFQHSLSLSIYIYICICNICINTCISVHTHMCICTDELHPRSSSLGYNL